MYKKRFANKLFLVLFMILTLTLGLSACGGGSGDEDGNTADTDGDGLTDERERTLGTSPVIADTDGDGFSDGKEVVDFGFNPGNNNFKFNPLIADTPNIQIEFVSLPDIDMDITTSTGSDISRGVERSVGSSSSYSRSRTNSYSLTVEASASLTDFGVSESFTAEESVTWSSEQTVENSQAYSNAVNNSVGEELTGGGIGIAVNVRNEGHLAFTVSNLVLSANLVNPQSNRVLEPIGNLVFDSVNAWNDFPVAPQASAGPFTYSNDGLTVAETRALLQDSSGLSVEVAVYDITDAEGNSYTHDLTAIGAKTAVVTIDYGPDNNRGVRSYLVATNSDPDLLTVSAGAIFSDILRLPYEQDANGLTSVDGVVVNQVNTEKWMVVHRYISGQDPVVDVYDPATSYDFNSINVQAGHTLHLVRAADTDNDGLGLREELLFGTNPDNPDSDGDTLTDGDEVKTGWVNNFNLAQVYSSPVLQDSDSDGVNDNTERSQNSNPNLADTDSDGQTDDVDAQPTVALVPPSTWNTVAAGNYHALGIKSDGTLWAWGSNSSGQLGLGDIVKRQLPVQIGSRNDWDKVFPCYFSSFAIANDGSLWAWGNNSLGKLGLGDDTHRNQPVQVGTDTNWDKLSCYYHTIALRTDGSLWSWGKNEQGQLGLGDTTPRSSPVQVGTAFDWDELVATANSTLLLKTSAPGSSGDLYITGTNQYGELANNGGPWLTPTLTTAYGVKLASSWGSTFHINHLGLLFSSGNNGGGKLGTGGTTQRNGWQQVSGTNYAEVAAGGLHTMAIVKAPASATGSLYGWGIDSAQVSSTTPMQIGSSSNWQQISIGWGFSLSLDGNDHLWAWGDNSSGQLGLNSDDPSISDMAVVQ